MDRGPHVHREGGEGFLVLEGRYRFVRGDEETEVGEGAFLFVPRGTRHTFRTLAAPSRVLIVVTPAGLDACFREIAEGLAAGRAGPDNMLELSARYDTAPRPVARGAARSAGQDPPLDPELAPPALSSGTGVRPTFLWGRAPRDVDGSGATPTGPRCRGRFRSRPPCGPSGPRRRAAGRPSRIPPSRPW